MEKDKMTPDHPMRPEEEAALDAAFARARAETPSPRIAFLQKVLADAERVAAEHRATARQADLATARQAEMPLVRQAEMPAERQAEKPAEPLAEPASQPVPAPRMPPRRAQTPDPVLRADPAHRPRPATRTHGPSLIERILAALGGGFGAGALTACAVTGFWLGYAAPEALSLDTLTATLTQGSESIGFAALDETYALLSEEF